MEKKSENANKANLFKQKKKADTSKTPLRGERGSSYGKLIAPKAPEITAPTGHCVAPVRGFDNPLGIDVTLPSRIGGLEGQ